MSYFDRNSRVFQILFALLVVFLLFIASINTHRYASSPTDENWFNNPASNLYVTKSFPADLVGLSTIAGEGELTSSQEDSIQVGDLILFINGRSQRNSLSVMKTLELVPADSTLRFDISRTRFNKDFDYVVNKSVVPDSFFIELPPTAYVFDVFPGGASEQAGMLVGDLIFSIDGQEFDDYYDADNILRRTRSGETVEYKVFRNNREIPLQVKIANFGIQFSMIVALLTGLIFLSLGAFLGIKRPNFFSARILGIVFVLIGYVLLVSYSRGIEVDHFVIIRDALRIIGLLLGVALWLHSFYYFPKQRSEDKPKFWEVGGPYLISGFVVLLVLTNALNEDMGIFVALISMVTYYLIIRVIQRKKISLEYKKLNRTIFWAVLILWILFLILLGGNFVNDGFISAIFILIPLAYLYTIGRYRIWELDLKVRRNIQYTILTIFWGTFVFGSLLFLLLVIANVNINLPNISFTGTSLQISDTPLPETRRNFFENILIIVVAIGLSALLLKIRNVGQKLIDEKYFRSHQSYQYISNALAEVMEHNLTMVDLAKGIVEKLSRLMHLRRAGILFFRNEISGCCHEVYGLQDKEWSEFCIEVEDKLITEIQRFRNEARFSVEFLPSNVRPIFEQMKFRHIIPIRSKDKLVGTLLIGDKLSEAPFDQEDLTLLNSIAKQAAIAVENAFLYEKLAGQERLKLELEIARRIQLASLPQTTPKLDELEIAGISIPATEVGGDYFDYLNGYPNRVTIIVGDVSGKGTSAALYLSKIQGIMRSLQSFDLTPRELFIRANVLLYKDLEKQSFITAIGASFDASNKQLVVARAGHLPLYHYQSNSRKIVLVIPKGLGLGLDTVEKFSSELEETTIHYNKGDVFLLITDGITEARGEGGEEYGEESLVDILKSGNSHSANQIRDEIMASVKKFTGDSHQHDDQTVVVVKAL